MNKKYCIANWKMNFTLHECKKYIDKWNDMDVSDDKVMTIICPPYTSLHLFANFLKNNTDYGAQNIFYENKGAFTGEISALMLKNLGCKWVIVGHSERRSILNESNEMINKKIINLLSEGLNPILCVGEKKEERLRGDTSTVINEQLSVAFKNIDLSFNNLMIIAYEPVWAIGSGLNAEYDQIKDVHNQIRNFINKKGLKNKNISIIYGGSVTKDNAENLSTIDNVDGFLIGGASLEVESYYNIYNKLQES